MPDEGEIARCGEHLDRELMLLAPRLVIGVGTLAAAQLTGVSQLKQGAGVRHRVERAGRRFDVVVLPHPSGRSTWLNDPKNQALLRQSLRLIVEHPAWRRTFP